MILIHDAMARGRTRTGWLDAFHSFSFGGFHDPARMGLGRLRVLNEDTIAPGAGFAPHDHADMDILTWPLSGRLRHEDSLGHAAEIGPGEVQLMSAGSGIRHSERNPSATEPAHLLQIWLIPDARGGAPEYHQHRLPEGAGQGAPLLIAGAGGVVPLRSSARVWLHRPAEGGRTVLPLAPGRIGFVQIVAGLAAMEGEGLRPGDGVQAAGAPLPPLDWRTAGEALLFDLPPL